MSSEDTVHRGRERDGEGLLKGRRPSPANRPQKTLKGNFSGEGLQHSSRPSPKEARKTGSRTAAGMAEQENEGGR